MRATRTKNLKFYVEILKKRSHWAWTVVKNGVVIGCKICLEKGDLKTWEKISKLGDAAKKTKQNKTKQNKTKNKKPHYDKPRPMKK